MFVAAIIAVTYVNLSININLIILYGGVSRWKFHEYLMILMLVNLLIMIWQYLFQWSS